MSRSRCEKRSHVHGASRASPTPGSTSSVSATTATEIARFDTELGTTIAPYTPLLLRSESAASSKIENLAASAKAIALAELGEQSRHDAGIIVANTRAMQFALELANDLNEQAILNLKDTR